LICFVPSHSALHAIASFIPVCYPLLLLQTLERSRKERKASHHLAPSNKRSHVGITAASVHSPMEAQRQVGHDAANTNLITPNTQMVSIS
jgi:hypothetical protein